MIAWQRSALYEKDGAQEDPPKGKLDYLLEILRQEDQRRIIKSSLFQTKESGKQVQKKKEQSFATAAGLHVTRHPSQECYTAIEMPLEEK